MPRFLTARVAAWALALPFTGWAAGGWADLKPGMTREEISIALGSELMASKGRGFEVAVYDRRAEVVFLNGQVVAWTAPKALVAPPSPTNAFQFDQVTRVRVTPTSLVRPVDSRAVPPRRNLILPAYRL